jgi:RNA polymerase sigma-70 factor (ECF subfamily)
MDPKASEPQPDGNAGGKRSAQREAVPGDGALVLQALSGQKPAFDQLVRRYQRQAVAVSYRLLGNTHDALEVTQEAFIKAYGSLASLQKQDAFGGWLLRIVSNLSLNFRRGRKSRQQLPLDDLLGPSEPTQAAGSSEWMARSGDPLHALESQELGVHLEEALQQLPPKQRQAIVLFTIHQMPQKDVAEQLGCSVEAVKWHVFQGRKKLKELLKDIL